MESVTVTDPVTGRTRTFQDQTYRRVVEITGDPVSGRVESCRIRVRDGDPVRKIDLLPDVRAEVDEHDLLLAILVLGFPGEPEDFDKALQAIGTDQATRCYIMGAIPVYFTS